ncbi:hypothetical protein MNEG_14323, partial [Monoraphidium neglectum]
AKICAQLDGALLTDEECGRYQEKWTALPDPAHGGAQPAPEGATIAGLAPLAAAEGEGGAGAHGHGHGAHGGH